MNVAANNQSQMSAGQKIAMHYFVAAMVLFLAQILFGMIAGLQFLYPDLLLDVLNFSISRMVHLNAMIVWMLFGFIGSVYWLVEDEAGTELVGAKLALANFWVLTTAVAIVVVVYLFVQIGPGEKASIWLINEGREYIEAPRWADIGIVTCVLIFFYNVAATFMKGKWSGISGVLVLDLVALAGIYLAGAFFVTNISIDQHWWWWVIHLWVEATWEVLVGCIMAWGLMKTLGTSRRIVTTWLYIEVAMMFGSGILGLGHHYFWIGTPEYWLTIGGFFSALEPIPLVAMVVHAVYDAGRHGFKSTNHPALAWLIAHAFGNFFGAGVLRFHAYAAADQFVYPRYPVDRFLWPFRLLWRLCHDKYCDDLYRYSEMAWRCMDVGTASGQRLEVEMVVGAAQRRRGRHDDGAIDRRIRTIIYRARGRWLHLERVF